LINALKKHYKSAQMVTPNTKTARE